eukprot:2662028-Prymnesium_polylepis.2
MERSALCVWQKRLRRLASMKTDACSTLRIQVRGGGPIGLRVATEMAMLGHKVRAVPLLLHARKCTTSPFLTWSALGVVRQKGDCLGDERPVLSSKRAQIVGGDFHRP